MKRKKLYFHFIHLLIYRWFIVSPPWRQLFSGLRKCSDSFLFLCTWFLVAGSGSVGEGKVEPPKKQSPLGPLGVEPASRPDVSKTSVVSPYQKRMFGPLQTVSISRGPTPSPGALGCWHHGSALLETNNRRRHRHKFFDQWQSAEKGQPPHQSPNCPLQQ